MKRAPLILMLAAALCAAVSCLEDMPIGRGGTIFFSASMGGVSTKTEYAGGSYATGEIEDIYWIDGDRIRILCDQAADPSGNPWADYTVTPTSDRTKGSITPVNKNGLHWGSGTHYFHASYPAEGVTFGSLTNTSRTFRATIPSGQGGSWNSSRTEYMPNMNNACMYAVATSEETTSQSKVRLKFKPLVTTFRISLTTLADSEIPEGTLLKKLELSSAVSDMAGDFSVKIDATGDNDVNCSDTTLYSPTRSVSLDLGSGIQLSKTQPRSFTLFTLPLMQDKLTLTLTFNNGVIRKLELKKSGEWLQFPACSKVFIDNMSVPNLLDATVYIDGQMLQNYQGDYYFPKFDFTPSKDSIVVWRGEQAAFSLYSSARPAPEYSYEWSTDAVNWYDRDVTDLPYTSTVSSDGRTFSTTPTERGTIYVRVTGTRGSGANVVQKQKIIKIRTQQLISLTLDPASESSSPIEMMVAPSPGIATRLIAPIVYYNDGQDPQNKLLGSGWTWQSSNASVCTVNPSGIVSAHWKGAEPVRLTCSITGGMDSFSATAWVRAYLPFVFEVYAASAVTIWKGETYYFTYTLEAGVLVVLNDSNTYVFGAGTNKSGNWNSATTAIRTGTNMTFTAVHPTYGSYKWPIQVRFTVRELESLSLDKSTVSLARGASTTLTPTVLYTDGISSGLNLGISASNCNWSSDNTSVCTVTNGKVTAASGVSGSAWVTCSLTRGSKTVSARCRVTVQ